MAVNNALILTADHEADGITGAITDRIKGAAPERSLVVAGHVDEDEGGSFIGSVNSVADGDLRGAVQPEEGEGGAGGDGALEDSGTCHFIQGCLVHA